MTHLLLQSLFYTYIVCLKKLNLALFIINIMIVNITMSPMWPLLTWDCMR